VFDRLMKTGEIKAGMLPLHTQQVTWLLHLALNTPDLQGALVTSVVDNDETMLHGKIKSGDVIMTFNGEKVWDPRDLARKAAVAPIGSDAVLGLSRGGLQQTVHVEIHEWPEDKPIVFAEGQKHIGLQLASAEVSNGKSVVTVASVDPMGTAADSGIQKGDIILEVQQTPVSDPDQALNIFHKEMSQKRKFAAVLVERDKKLSWMPLAIP
jgi:serine protease Do